MPGGSPPSPLLLAVPLLLPSSEGFEPDDAPEDDVLLAPSAPLSPGVLQLLAVKPYA